MIVTDIRIATNKHNCQRKNFMTYYSITYEVR